MKKLTISCAGDENFKRKMKLLSVKTGQDMGDLVRSAIDEKYGAALAEMDDSFFASECASTHIKNEKDHIAKSA